eukprot:comp24128_c1_seq1/m.43803 comp24128_c1_seq1/g.43803  ORF comp24128_c1_seq1/g.43803 comp24128_c1_seq1/m.43803 type:complete len:531 (-) comp24128_c1_seq1:31-1623(-)
MSAPVMQIDPEALSFMDIGLLFIRKIQDSMPGLPENLWPGEYLELYVKPWLNVYVKPWWDAYIRTLYTEDYSSYHVLIEVLLFLVLLKLLITPRERKSKEGEKLTEKEIDALVEEYEPEPLMSRLVDEADRAVVQRPVVVGPATPVSKYSDGKERINLATYDFLALVGDKEVEEEAKKSIRSHGVGSCGPRGFYGTIDSHMTLEDNLAKFLGVEEVILYSYGFATVASAIPAYAKRGDIIFCDQGVSFAIQKGLQASRSNLRWFKHNDIEDLERVLKEQEEEDRRKPAKAAKIRRFLVIEGLYANFGDICPLPKIVELKYKYKFRIFMEESMSFGVLGKTGKGVTEHFGVNITDIDQICASMEGALGSVGGFCAGSTFVIDHQRLSGAGYCFSASLPPFLADAASCGLRRMEAQPDMFQDLQRKSQYLRQLLQGKLRWVAVGGDDISPIIHLRISDSSMQYDQQNSELQRIVDRCWDKGLALTRSKYIVDKEVFNPAPSIRIVISIGHTEQQLKKAADTIITVCKDLTSE